MQQQKMQQPDAKASVPIISTANASTKGEAVQMAAVAAAMGKKKKQKKSLEKLISSLFC